VVGTCCVPSRAHREAHREMMNADTLKKATYPAKGQWGRKRQKAGQRESLRANKWTRQGTN
jgi:hypothetical protein